MSKVHPLGEVALSSERSLRRGQTLFYTDAVNLLRQLYSPQDYRYRDDFDGELLILRGAELLISVEIKSEAEADALSTTSGKKFADVRTAINRNESLSGKQKGWMACVAQCWDYMETGLPTDLRSVQFAERRDILVVPLDSEQDLIGALQSVRSSNPNYILPDPFAVRFPSDNVTVLHFCHADLTTLFTRMKTGEQIHSEPSAAAYGLPPAAEP